MKTKDIVRQYVDKHPQLTSSQICEKIFKEKKDIVQVNKKTLQKIINKVQKESSISIDLIKEQKWSVTNNVYHWTASRGTIEMSVEFIDQLFYEYSEHGKNLSQTEIINKHNLKVWQWNSIKSTLQLFKKSNIFSPHTVEITPTEELSKMIGDKIEKMLSNVGEQVKTIYDKQVNKAYKKAILEIEEWNTIKKIFLTELADIVPKLTIDLKPSLSINNEGNNCISVFIADVHFGAESRTQSISPYNPQIVEELFIEIAEEVNKLKAAEVHVFFVGDNIESATGLNHLDSWKGLSKGYYGSKLIIEAYQAYVRFLSQINNLAAIYAVPGNHDRMTDRKEIDNQGFMGEILFEMIKLAFNNKLEVYYEEKVITKSIDSLHFIMTHGHLKLTNINPAELIYEYGDPYKYNVVISGHLHNRKVTKDHRNFRQLVCPSIFPGNDYSENLGVNSTPGFLIIKSKNGKPIVIDYPL